jgi:hypothetical protein
MYLGHGFVVEKMCIDDVSNFSGKLLVECICETLDAPNS